jgi:hypothetical protein
MQRGTVQSTRHDIGVPHFSGVEQAASGGSGTFSESDITASSEPGTDEVAARTETGRGAIVVSRLDSLVTPGTKLGLGGIVASKQSTGFGAVNNDRPPELPG